jgi:hypothetical protein
MKAPRLDVTVYEVTGAGVDRLPNSPKFERLGGPTKFEQEGGLPATMQLYRGLVPVAQNRKPVVVYVGKVTLTSIVAPDLPSHICVFCPARKVAASTANEIVSWFGVMAEAMTMKTPWLRQIMEYVRTIWEIHTGCVEDGPSREPPAPSSSETTSAVSTLGSCLIASHGHPEERGRWFGDE